jgi:hypothetical protein
MIDKNLLLIKYPSATKTQVNAAIKYEEKFQLTIDNLKCLNPKCNNMRKWNASTTSFNYCCSKDCHSIMKDQINIIKSTKLKGRIPSELEKQKKSISFAKLDKLIMQQKREQTCLSKYGFINQNMNPEIIKKRKQTISQISKEEKENWYIKARQTYYDRTGYHHHFSNPTIKKIKEKNPNYYHYSNYNNWNNREFWLQTFITDDNNFDYIKCMKYFNCKQPSTHNQIKKLGISYKKLSGTSLQEQLLIPFLESLDLKVETNVRNIIPNMELDIWLPELALAIEWNGIYWHSYHETNGTSSKQLDLNYMKYRHQRKSIACIECGIRLLHLYEDQHLDNWQEAVQAFILYEHEAMEIYDLDNGCYPLDIDLNKITEPVARSVGNHRILWDAGYINF